MGKKKYLPNSIFWNGQAKIVDVHDQGFSFFSFFSSFFSFLSLIGRHVTRGVTFIGTIAYDNSCSWEFFV